MSPGEKATYNAWRDSQVHRVGGKVQREAESILDKHDAEETIVMNDEVSGRRVEMKADVAEVLRSRGHASRPKTYFFMNGK